MVIAALILSVLALFLFGMGCYLEGFVTELYRAFFRKRYICRRCKQEIAVKEVEEDLHNPLSTMRE